LRADPHFAPAHSNLGYRLSDKGDLRNALSHFRAAEAESEKEDTDQAHESLPMIRSQIQRLEPMVGRFDDIVHGHRLASSNLEWSRAIWMEYQCRHLDAIVELAERTLRDNPELAMGIPRGLYNAACAAALLAADATKPADRLRYSKLARSWLALDSDYMAKVIPDGAATAATALKNLRRSLEDPDFASVRGDALKALPEPERGAWQALWAKIERIVKRQR